MKKGLQHDRDPVPTMDFYSEADMRRADGSYGYNAKMRNQTPEEFIARYQRKDIMSNASVAIYESRRRLLIGARQGLVQTDYVIPWEGKITKPTEEIA